jgi:hypothetical protein
MDGLEDRGRVLIIGTTNRPDDIDPVRAALSGPHGFRPRRGCHTALAAIYDNPKVRIDWVVVTGLKKLGHFEC